ncbi:MAG: response regulator [Actinomycetota bacterium]
MPHDCLRHQAGQGSADRRRVVHPFDNPPDPVGIPQANVYEAGTARAGATETMRMRPHMVLCDIHMPDDDGFVYVEHVRKAPIPEVAATPIVMRTSDSTEEAVLTARQLKVEGYLVKPVSIAAVRKAVERALKVELK